MGSACSTVSIVRTQPSGSKGHECSTVHTTVFHKTNKTDRRRKWKEIMEFEEKD